MPRKNIFVLAMPGSSSFLHPGHMSSPVNFPGSQMDGVPISKASEKWIDHMFVFAVESSLRKRIN